MDLPLAVEQTSIPGRSGEGRDFGYIRGLVGQFRPFISPTGNRPTRISDADVVIADRQRFEAAAWNIRDKPAPVLPPTLDLTARPQRTGQAGGTTDSRIPTPCGGIGHLTVVTRAEVIRPPTSNFPLSSDRAGVVLAHGHLDQIRFSRCFLRQIILVIPPTVDTAQLIDCTTSVRVETVMHPWETIELRAVYRPDNHGLIRVPFRVIVAGVVTAKRVPDRGRIRRDLYVGYRRTSVRIICDNHEPAPHLVSHTPFLVRRCGAANDLVINTKIVVKRVNCAGHERSVHLPSVGNDGVRQVFIDVFDHRRAA